MKNCDPCIFIHGLFGSSHGVKATILKKLFPKIIIPDFTGTLNERMAVLMPILDNRENWTIIGSSFGGLMAAIYTCRKPELVRKLVLFAPALVWQDFKADMLAPTAVPTVVYHGKRDETVPMEPVKELAEQIFINLDFQVVDDDHGLYKTVHEIDWLEVIR